MIDRLEDEIRQYRIEYQRFFNGDAKVPPEEAAEQIRKHLRELTVVPRLSQVERYRLGGLEGRYNSLTELHRRRMRDLDTQHRVLTETEPAAPRSPASIVVDSGTGTHGLDSLYAALYSDGQAPVAREDFHAYVLDQADKLRRSTGCTRVRFTVRSSDGKQRLKARPLPSDAPE